MPDTQTLSALYYPHTTVRDEGVLRHALLVWDRVSFIVPWRGFLQNQDAPPMVRQTMELIGEEVEVEKTAKDAVYKALAALVSKPIPPWLTLSTPPKADLDILKHEYAIFPQKLDDRIARLLTEHKLARFKGSDEDIYTNPALGLLVMALIAQESAGTTKHTVTDRAAAYEWLAKYAFERHSAEGAVAVQANTHMARLHLLSLGALDLDSLPLERLVAMRQREASGNEGADYRKFRRHYLKRLQDCAQRLAKATLQADVTTIEQEYSEAMRDDVTFLRHALQDNAFTAILSKETGLAVAGSGATLLTAGAVTVPSGIAAGLGALGVVQKFRTGAKKALSEHPIAWMYLASRGGLTRRLLT